MQITEIQNKMTGLALIISCCMLIVFSGCEDQRKQKVSWTEYEPVYMTTEEFDKSVVFEESRPIQDAGKIYFFDGYLFINEPHKGVHIIDNRNPASPSQEGFINIPGSRDVAVHGNLLYSDAHTDLLVLDISNLPKVEIVSRKKEIFEFNHPGFPYREVDESKGMIVDWEPVEMEEICEDECYPVNNHRWGGTFTGRVNDNQTMAESSGGSQGVPAPSAGIGGSMARFAVSGNYMYVVDDKNLLTFNIAAAEPNLINEKYVGWAIETIFPHKNSLYIGSESAMYIFDITSPASPNQLSRYRHTTACDPVVVENDYAYVTLREGDLCPRGVNRLEVVDVSDRSNPEKVDFYEMINPHGLGIDDGNLFISEGDDGLKVMDASNPYDVKELRHIKNIKSFDVIPYNNVLMVTGNSGIIQYDYSDIENLKKLSVIPVR